MALLQKGYLGATPLWRDLQWYQLNSNFPVGITQTTITANTAAHTKGSWIQLTSSLSGDTSFLIFTVINIAVNDANSASLLDIGIGGSGAEVAIAENIAIGGARNVGGIVCAFPIKLAAGTRVAARLQSVLTGGKTCFMIAHYLNHGDYGVAPTTVDVIGGDTATSKGIEFSGASGTWVEGIASTSKAYRAFSVIPSLHTNAASNFRILSLSIRISFPFCFSLKVAPLLSPQEVALP